MDKSILRQIMLNKRQSLSEAEIKRISDKIFNLFISLPLVKNSNYIMSYMPINNEVDVLPFNKWVLDSGKVLCLPKVKSLEEMDAIKINNLKNNLSKGSFGIMEPAPDNRMADCDKIDLIIVPGLAFDKIGNRIGHGKGYYDRFLSRCSKNTVLLGVAYSFQILDNIPADDFDKRVNAVISENGITICFLE